MKITSDDFIMWLGGFLDGTDGSLDTEQIGKVRSMMLRVEKSIKPAMEWIKPDNIYSRTLYNEDPKKDNYSSMTFSEKPIYSKESILPKVDPNKIQRSGN